MRLYSYWCSSCSHRVRIALHLKGVRFEYQPVHLIKSGGGQFQESFKALSPLSQVPCLEHEGRALSQSLPILLYLERLWPEPRLLPADPFQRAEVLSACEMINSGVQPLQNLSVLNYVEGDLKGDKIRWARFWIERGLQGIERFLKPRAGDFAFGGRLTMADLFLIPQIAGARRFQADLERLPLLRRIERSCLALPAFQKARPENQPDAPAASSG